MIDYKFSLELTKNGIQKRIHAKAGESNSRRLVITLTESGKVMSLDGLSASVFFENSTKAKNNPERINDVFVFVLPSELTAQEGTRICELKITHDNNVIFSPMFEVVVEKSLGNVSPDYVVEVGEAVRYQEAITISTDEKLEMTDNDSFVVHDAYEGKIKRYLWKKFWELHNASNSHHMNMVSGLIPTFSDRDQRFEDHVDENNQKFAELDGKNENQDAKIHTNLIDIEYLKYNYNELSEYLYNIVSSDIADLQNLKHSHTNKSVIDKFSEQDGKLLFDKKPIESTGTGSTYIDVEIKSDTDDEYVLEIKTDNKVITTPNLKGVDGEDGKSGVYVGSGKMPDGYNVQIDPEGEAVVIPTKTSELTNDSGFITRNDLPEGGNGVDGFSPVVNIAKIEGGHRVSVVDSTGEKSFDVLDGKKGDPYTLTEADKNAIVEAVKEALPKYNGEVIPI